MAQTHTQRLVSGFNRLWFKTDMDSKRPEVISWGDEIVFILIVMIVI